MTTSELISYIRQRLDQDAERSVITEELTGNGWELEDVEEAFAEFDKQQVDTESYDEDEAELEDGGADEVQKEAPPVSKEKNDSFVHKEKKPQVEHIKNKREPTVVDKKFVAGESDIHVDSFDRDESKHGGSKLLVIFSLILLVLLVGGGVYAYLTFFQNGNSVRDIFNKAIDTSVGLRSASVSGDFRIKGIVPSQQLENYILNGAPSPIEGDTELSVLTEFSGSFDLLDWEDIKFSFQFDTSLRGEDLQLLTGLSSFDFGMELRFVDDTLYVQLTSLPDFGLLWFNPSVLTNRWVYIDLDDITDETIEVFNESDVPEFLFREVFEELMDQVVMWYKDDNTLTSLERLEDTVVDGSSVYHLRAQLNAEAFRNLSKQLNEFMISNYGNTLRLRDEDVLDIGFGVTTMEMWVDKSNYHTRKASLQSRDLEGSIEDEWILEEIESTVRYSNHNQPQQIEVPANAISLEDLLVEIFGAMFGEEFFIDYDDEFSEFYLEEDVIRSIEE